MIKKHQLNPTYVYNRIKQIIFQQLNPEAPWLTQRSIKLLDELIRPIDIGLEFGSGRSTIWFAKRCRYLVSIEHNQQWYEKIAAQLNNLNNIDYYFKELNKIPQNSEYYKIICEFKDSYFDFILIDGKYRELLSLEAINKLKPGGLLIFDNAERYLPNKFKTPESIGLNYNKLQNEMNEFSKLTSNWRKIWTTNGISTTLILIKPF